jgi:hypothetical protein
VVNALEVRAFGDGPEAASALLQRVWRADYEGRMWFPLWDPAFMAWQLGGPGGSLGVGVYDRDEPVACAFAVCHDLRVGAATVPITFSSWFALEPRYRLPRVALQLTAALRAQHLAAGKAFSLGVVSGDPTSAAHRFWSMYAKAAPGDLRFLMRFGFWAKVLDPPGLARAGIHRWERLGAAAGTTVLGRSPWPSDPAVRPYIGADLPACQALLERAAAPLDWSVAWQSPVLAAQLAGDVPRTLVREKAGRVAALVNYHHARLQGRQPVRTAVVDLWAAEGLGFVDAARLMATACRAARKEGAQIMMCLRSDAMPGPVLLANGFLPLPRVDHLVAMFPGPAGMPTAPGRWHLLFR